MDKKTIKIGGEFCTVLETEKKTRNGKFQLLFFRDSRSDLIRGYAIEIRRSKWTKREYEHIHHIHSHTKKSHIRAYFERQGFDRMVEEYKSEYYHL